MLGLFLTGYVTAAAGFYYWMRQKATSVQEESRLLEEIRNLNNQDQSTEIIHLFEERRDQKSA